MNLNSRRTNLLMLIFMLSIPLYASRPRSHGEIERPKGMVTAQEHVAALSALSADYQEFLIVGYGAPRSGFEDCNRDASRFAKMLEAKGVHPIERIVCVNPPGDNDSFVPSFRAKSAKNYEFTTLLGGTFSTLTYCELERDQLVQEALKKGIVLESTCKVTQVSDMNNAPVDVYQPAVVTMTSLQPDPTRLYNSAQVLLDSVDATRSKVYFKAQN